MFLIPVLMRQRHADLCEFEARLVYRVPGQPKVQREILSQKTKQNNFSLHGFNLQGNTSNMTIVEYTSEFSGVPPATLFPSLTGSLNGLQNHLHIYLKLITSMGI